MACGIAGLSVVADSLSAIKYAKVKVIRDETGLAIDYKAEGDFPKYGNDDDRVDQIAVDVVKTFLNKLQKHQLTEIQNIHYQYLQLHQMLYMVKIQETHLMEEELENLLDQEQILYMEEM